MSADTYVLQSEKVIYRIRPRDEKHPVLLPVGEQAQFRMQKDKMILRVEDLHDKGPRVHRSFHDAARRQQFREGCTEISTASIGTSF